ncbi:MAG: TonB-dependent receptor [Henriciella sp.]
MTRFLTSTALATIFFASAGPLASAQVLTGTVTDASGEAPLEGAIVSIDGLNRSTSTDRFGDYRIANLPAGDYTVLVSYIGTDEVSANVTIPESGTVLDLTIGADVRYLDNILVVGSAAAQAGALNQQRASDAIISVIDSDGLGNFPDTTVADSLARVPGLSIETDQGEGRYVSIRGINTDLISTSINGVRTPSPEDRRGVMLDGVPSDLLDGITVQKSLTPDVDADSLGGVIDLKTVSAFDRKGRFIRAKVEGAYNEITEEISPKATLTYTETFNDKFGVALSLNYQDLRIESHNNEAGGAGQIDDMGVFFMDDDYEQRWYDLTRERIGLVGNFDYRMSETTDLYFRTLFNNYTDDEVRNKFEYKDLDDGAPDSSTQATLPINEIDAETRLRSETRQIQTYALGGQTNLDTWTFDYELAYAYAEQDDSDNHDITFRFEDVQDAGAGDLIFDTSNPETPRLTGDAALALIFDPSNYVLDELEEEFSVNEDTEISFKFDVSKDVVYGNTPITWKGGVKFRDREKTRDVNKVFHGLQEDAFGDDILVSLTPFAGQTFIDGWRLPNAMPAFPDPNLTRALRGNGLGNLALDDEASDFESLAEDYLIDEQILAGYAMGTFDLGQLNIVAGVRVEQTSTDLQGNIFSEGQDPTADLAIRSVSQDYTDVLPSVNVKYDFSDKLVGRAAYYAAAVRPAFGEYAPILARNDDQDEAFAGNPDLDRLQADNFDLTLEYYPTELSVLSVGVFYKDIENAVFGTVVERDGDTTADFLARVPTDLSFLPQAELDILEEIETFTNVDESSITGIEFNYVQGLGDLNEALDGLLVSANLTLVDGEATLPDGREVPFIDQSETIWNLAVGYDKGPWDLRVSANFRGSYLDELEGTADDGTVLDRTVDDRLLIEASAKYDVSDKLQVYLEGKNITDEPEYYYFGDESRLSQYDEFGSTWIIGARYTF